MNDQMKQVSRKQFRIMASLEEAFEGDKDMN
jgi:hypothetical protein